MANQENHEKDRVISDLPRMKRHLEGG